MTKQHDPSPPSDEELMDRVRDADDETAFNELYRRHDPDTVRERVKSVIRTPADRSGGTIDAAANRTWDNVWVGRKTWSADKADHGFKAWVGTIAKRAAHDELKALRRGQPVPSAQPPGGSGTTDPDRPRGYDALNEVGIPDATPAVIDLAEELVFVLRSYAPLKQEVILQRYLGVGREALGLKEPDNDNTPQGSSSTCNGLEASEIHESHNENTPQVSPTTSNGLTLLEKLELGWLLTTHNRDCRPSPHLAQVLHDSYVRAPSRTLEKVADMLGLKMHQVFNICRRYRKDVNRRWTE